MEDASKAELEETNVLVNIQSVSSPSDSQSSKTVSFANMTFCKTSEGTKRKLSSPIHSSSKKPNLDANPAIDVANFFSHFDPYVKINPNMDQTWHPKTDNDMTINVSWDDTKNDGDCEDDLIANVTWDETETDGGCEEDKARICSNCSLGAVVVACCNQCFEDPHLCQVCVEAHQRVRLTRSHQINFDLPIGTLFEGEIDRIQMFQRVLDAIDPTRDLTKHDKFQARENIKYTTGVFIRKVSSECSDEKLRHELPESAIADNLLGLLSGGHVEVKARTALVIDRLVKENLINPSLLCDDRGVGGFSSLLSYPDVELLDPGLKAIQQLVLALVKIDACFSLAKLSQGLTQCLEILKDSEFSFNSSRPGALDSFGFCNQLYLDENHLHCPLYGCNPACLNKRAQDILSKLQNQ